MKKFRIVTCTECYTEYFVNAENKQEAVDMFEDGQYYDDKDIDFRNEEIEEVEEVEE